MKSLLFFFTVFTLFISASAGWEKINSVQLSGSVKFIESFGSDIYACSSSGLFRSCDNGDSWERLGNFANVTAFYFEFPYYYAGTENDFIYRSKDGIGWVKLSDGLENGSVSAVISNGPVVYAAVNIDLLESKMFVSEDYGNTWHAEIYGVYSSFHKEDGSIYCSRSDKPEGVLKSFNNSYFNSIGPKEYMKAIDVFDNTDHLNIFAASLNRGIYYSGDNGRTWLPKNNGILKGALSSAIDSYQNFVVYGTSNKGLFLSTDLGNTWNELNNGIDNKNVLSLEMEYPYIYAGMSDGSVWRYSMIVKDNAKDKNESLRSDHLSGSRLVGGYPNPFNPSTNVSFILGIAGLVSINVYNSTGQLVKELFNNALEAGSYKVQFNASGLSSGIYFVKMITSEFIDTKKIVLTK